MEGIADLSTLRQISISWIGCGPDDLPIAVREVGTEEIYALDLNARPDPNKTPDVAGVSSNLWKTIWRKRKLRC